MMATQIIKVYGLKNCDTTRKAVKILRENGKTAEIYDLRAEGVPLKHLKEWVRQMGWETMLNRRGTTWRQLPEDRKEALDEAKALKLMQEFPALIKRPVMAGKAGPIVGLKAPELARLKREF